MSPRRMTPPLPSQHPPLPSPARRETRGAPGKHPAARSPPTSLRRARQRSVELAQLLPNHCGRQRQGLSVALHRLLSLPADDEAQEFLPLTAAMVREQLRKLDAQSEEHTSELQSQSKLVCR